ncbi:MAG: ATP-binding cassette domain-containing protein [Clostridiales bacterium]|nr:ATP-binding cassette domain-containing protein [Candidatus Crickella equi]
MALKYYKTIGQIQSKVNQSKTLDEAIQGGLGVILDETGADAAVVWYRDENGDDMLHPYYWVCPLDITTKTYKVGEGVVGRVYKSHEVERMYNYSLGDDKQTDENFRGMTITSLICAPFGDGDNTDGCVQLFKNEGAFTEEEADVCDIMTLMVAMAIRENKQIEIPYRYHNALISANGITKEYSNGEIITRVLKGVNLDIYEGEFLAVLGESGCGKSTLLNIIGGLDTATSGSFSFMGKDMTGASQAELTKFRRDNIGFIFQGYNLMNNLTAKQNLDLIGELVENPMSSEEALGMVKLEDKLSNYPSQLSGGQQQRVSIARALVKKPKLIFADEPTAALDYATSIEVLSVLENVIAEGTTLVMVTHNEEITRMADRVVRIRDGKTYEVSVNRRRAKATDLVW